MHAPRAPPSVLEPTARWSGSPHPQLFQLSPPDVALPPAPAQCASLGPKYRAECCAEKKYNGVYDRACKKAYKPKTCSSLKKRSYRAFKKCCESDNADFT